MFLRKRNNQPKKIHTPKKYFLIISAVFLFATAGVIYKYLSLAVTVDLTSNISGVVERDQIKLINERRASKSKPVVKRSSCLTLAAREWSKHMMDKGAHHNTSEAHKNSDHTHAGYLSTKIKEYCGNYPTPAAENIAIMGSSGSIFNAFIDSTVHRQNIDNSDYNYSGVGAYVDGSSIAVTQIFVKCTGTCDDGSQWKATLNDPPQPYLVLPAANNVFAECTTKTTLSAKATDSAHKSKIAIDYWVKNTGDLDETYQRLGWANMNDTNGSWSSYVSSGTNLYATIYIDTNKSGKTYRWRAQARDSSGFLGVHPGTSFPNHIDFKEELTLYRYFTVNPDVTNPTRPESFQVLSQTSNAVKLGWQSSTDNCGLSKYELHRTEVSVPINKVKFDIPATATSHNDINLNPGTAYVYQLCAVDKNLNTRCSSENPTAVTQP